MLCKLELKSIKMIAEREYAEKQRKLDEIAKEKLQHIKEETIAYCENELNEIFLKKAENIEPLTFTKKFHLEKDRLGNILAYSLKLENCTYANGDESYRPDEKQIFDLSTMESHLKAHCFSIDYEDSFYKQYGFGDRKSKTMIISAE